VNANVKHTERIVKKVTGAVGGNLTDKVVAVWGLAFKAGTNDLRSSPALKILTSLQTQGAHIRAYDPTMEDPLAGVEVVDTKEDACVGADVLLVTTEWPEFSRVDLSTIGDLMTQRSIVDARNVINVEGAQRAGFDYVGVGLGRTTLKVSDAWSNHQLNTSREFL
jgi:UDPglucose 6-dehydrogenase